MFKYISFILLLSISYAVFAHHTLSSANVAVTQILTPVIQKDNCQITNRQNTELVDTDDIIFVVTVICGGGSKTVQYLINVYGTEYAPINTTPPVVVGAHDNFIADILSVNQNVIKLFGNIEVKSPDLPCCQYRPVIHTYKVFNHGFRKVNGY